MANSIRHIILTHRSERINVEAWAEQKMRGAQRVVVVGAGIGGLVAAIHLAQRGVEVDLIECADGPGGKMSEAVIGETAIDAGPTVLTMRWVFDEILSDAGVSLSSRLNLKPAQILARHAWGSGERLDLFASADQSAMAIREFAGKVEAEGYLRFCRRARAIYQTLEAPFIRSSRPTLLGLMQRVGFAGLGDLSRISPFTTLWSALGGYFRDPRLLQLFGRYATYCGSSPFRAAATLMLVAHVEMEGVWLVDGGMHRLARLLADVAAAKGAILRYGARVDRILVENGRVSGVAIAGGEQLRADAAIWNGDVAALAQQLPGHDAAKTPRPTPRPARSLSAVTWALSAKTRGFSLLRHNVFFSDDYRAEFSDIFVRARLPRQPTVYVCAQDRDASAASGDAAMSSERLLCLVNAPPNGDVGEFDAAELQSCEEATFRLLSRCGLEVDWTEARGARTTPAQFERRFPATGGALYGRVSHGWVASFSRPGSKTKIPGLYLAGGSVHPGPGVPMAALSGRQAAQTLMAEFASTIRSAPAAMPGFTSMR
jgi:1-hydroxycarotenoid 3,4-desaturase